MVKVRHRRPMSKRIGASITIRFFGALSGLRGRHSFPKAALGSRLPWAGLWEAVGLAKKLLIFPHFDELRLRFFGRSVGCWRTILLLAVRLHLRPRPR